MHWITGADEREDKRFKDAGDSARLLYIDAGAWVQQQFFNNHRDPLPHEWFIPAALVREWSKNKPAAALVREGLWERAELDGKAGYVYRWLRFENTPAYIERKREQYRLEHERKKRSKANGQRAKTGGLPGG
jgi:hypothetical protein